MSSALSQAAQLKPEIRLAQALSEFCAGLPENQMREFRSLQTRSPPDANDVIRLTEEINRDGSRTHKSWRPYATSMSLFLERVQSLSRVGNFLVGSSQNLIASGVGTAVKMSLGGFCVTVETFRNIPSDIEDIVGAMVVKADISETIASPSPVNFTVQIAVSSLLFFKRLSELFLRIAKSTPITRDIVQVFPSSGDLQGLTCEYLITLVSFCGKIVRALRKTTILQLTSPFVGFFDKEASQFEKELAHWSNCIDRQAMLLLSKRQVDTADTITNIGRNLVRWVSSDKETETRLILRSRQLQDQLCPWQAERIRDWRRRRKKGTTECVFREENYQIWREFRDDLALSRTLLIQGKLGSGKTVVLANIVAKLHSFEPPQAGVGDGPDYITAYHFCNRDRAGAETFEHIMGSILQQLVAQIDLHSQPISELEKHFAIPSRLDSGLLDTICRALPKDYAIFLVLDALDEFAEVMDEVLAALRPTSKTHPIRLCLSTRPSNRPTTLVGWGILIRMASDAARKNMKDYVEAEFERNIHIRNLDSSLEETLKELLVDALEGMYLWLALQLNVLFPPPNTTLVTPSDVAQLLDKPPKDLSEALNNALEKIRDTRYGN